MSLSSKGAGGGGGGGGDSSDGDSDGDGDVDETHAAVPQNTDKVVNDFEEELVSLKVEVEDDVILVLFYDFFSLLLFIILLFIISSGTSQGGPCYPRPFHDQGRGAAEEVGRSFQGQDYREADRDTLTDGC